MKADHNKTYFDVKYLRRNARDYVSCASLEVGDFVSHDCRLEDVTAATVLHESSITEVHHQATRLIVQCN